MSLSLLFLDDRPTQFPDQLASWLDKFTFWFKPQVLLIFQKGSLGLTYPQEYISGDQMGFGKIRFQLERAANSGAGPGDVSLIPIKAPESKVSVPGFFVELEALQ